MKRREKRNDGSLRDSEEIDNNKVVRALISPNKILNIIEIIP